MDYPILDLVEGWRFRLDEGSPGVYEIEGLDHGGRRVFRTGVDPYALKQQAVADAKLVTAQWPSSKSMRLAVSAEIYFRATADGGRKGPILGGSFRCPSNIDGDYFDVLLTFSEPGSVNPGQTVTATIEFLSPDVVLARLFVGKQFTLWEGGTIADVEVIGVDAGV